VCRACVEHGPMSCVVATHVLEGLVDQQLEHDELVDRELRHPLRQRIDCRMRRSAGRLSDQSDRGRGLAVDRVAGEQEALGAFEADTIHHNAVVGVPQTRDGG